METNLEDMTTDQLETIISTAEEKYFSIIEFVERAVENIGRTTEYSVHSSNIAHNRVVNISGFNIEYHLGQSMMGGNTVYISRQGENNVLVMSHLSTIPEKEKIIIDTYVPGDWEETFMNLIDQQDRVFAEYINSHPNLAEEKEYDAQRMQKEHARADKARNERMTAIRHKFTPEQQAQKKEREKREKLIARAKKLKI